VILLEDLGAGDVRRHEIRRELDALKRQVEGLGEGRDQERLGEPGHADEQRVTAREQRDQELLDHAALADDPLVDLGHDLVVGLRELGDRVEVVLDDDAGVLVGERQIFGITVQHGDVRELLAGDRGVARLVHQFFTRRSINAARRWDPGAAIRAAWRARIACRSSEACGAGASRHRLNSSAGRMQSALVRLADRWSEHTPLPARSAWLDRTDSRPAPARRR
jgi:hypothetical protein